MDKISHRRRIKSNQRELASFPKRVRHHLNKIKKRDNRNKLDHNNSSRDLPNNKEIIVLQDKDNRHHNKRSSQLNKRDALNNNNLSHKDKRLKLK